MGDEYFEWCEQKQYDWCKKDISAPERRVLLTQFIGRAWTKLKANYQSTIERSFIKTGFLIKLDKSDVNEINLGPTVKNYSFGDMDISKQQHHNHISPAEIAEFGRIEYISKNKAIISDNESEDIPLIWCKVCSEYPCICGQDLVIENLIDSESESEEFSPETLQNF